MIGHPSQLLRSLKARRAAALAGLAAMLFAQAALALAVCGFDAAQSPARHLLSSAPVEKAPCHEEAQDVQALCAAHCQASEPALDKSQAKPPAPPVASWSAAVLFLAPTFVHAVPRVTQPQAASPPARILFQSLLI